jgi:hypothetical protein
MAVKKKVYEPELMGLPHLRLVMDDIPLPDPERQFRAAQKQQKLDPDVEDTIKRLIAHLRENRK